MFHYKPSILGCPHSKSHLSVWPAFLLRPLDLSLSLETAGVHHGDSLTAIVQEPRLAATDKAFALWCPGGGVVTWGDAESGGCHGEQLKEVQHLCASNSAFAAVSHGGKLACWGKLLDIAGWEPRSFCVLPFDG